MHLIGGSLLAQYSALDQFQELIDSILHLVLQEDATSVKHFQFAVNLLMPLLASNHRKQKTTSVNRFESPPKQTVLYTSSLPPMPLPPLLSLRNSKITTRPSIRRHIQLGLGNPKPRRHGNAQLVQLQPRNHGEDCIPDVDAPLALRVHILHRLIHAGTLL